MARRSAVLVGVGALIGAALTLAPLGFSRGPRPATADPETPKLEQSVEGAAGVAATTAEVEATAPIAVPAPDERPTYAPTRSFAPLVEAVSPAVLAIAVEGTVAAADQPDMSQVPPMFRRFMDPSQQGPQQEHGEGSGFIVSADGIVLTNNHVIEHADSIVAKFADGRTVKAKVIGADPELDIAMLKLDGDGPWPFVALGDSTDVKVGDWVLAVGNPLGLGTSVTAGIISGKGRVLGHDVYDDFLQTDAAINPGNSGGPLFDLDGKVIGINTAIINGANTVGFSIPIDMVARVMDDLESKGHVARGFIGVRPGATDGDHGAEIAEIYDDTPAAKAGLQAGDVVTKVDDHAVNDPAELVRTIGTRDPGDKVVLEVQRKGKTLAIPVELAERPADNAMPAEPSSDIARMGVKFEALTSDEAAQVGVQYGVRVAEVTVDAPAAGFLRAGDIVVEVNNWPVASPDQIADLVRRSKGAVQMLVIRDGKHASVIVPVR